MVRFISAGRLCLCVALLVCSSNASAQAASESDAVAAPAAANDRTEEAKALFAAGRSAFEAGRYSDALEHFQRCYAISQRPALLYNIALAQDRLRDDEKALASYEAYLAAVPDADNREEVEVRAAAIREALDRRGTAAEAAPVAPTPEAAAATMASDDAYTQPPEAQPSDEGSVFEQWWFWTVVAAVVVAGGVTVAVVASDGGEETQGPLPPKSGVVITTLGVEP